MQRIAIFLVMILAGLLALGAHKEKVKAKPLSRKMVEKSYTIIEQ
jgi:hypothetical protein